MIQEAIELLVNGNDLSSEMAQDVMNEIMSGEATQAQVGAYLTALRAKGETIDEIAASAIGMREKAVHLEHDDTDLMEIVGTGGDKSFTFNISTISSIVIAASGSPIAKHGNRSMSSKSGAADVLEALGVNLTLTPEQNAKVLREHGICFMFAQVYHPAMKYAGPVRKQIGIRNVFNMLGPLTSPASANLNLIGVYSKDLVEPIAHVLEKLGVKRAITMCGSDGLDEITLTGKTYCCYMNEGKYETFELDPHDYGMEYCAPSELVGGDPQENARIGVDILTGKETGAKRNIVLLNAGVGIAVAKDIPIADGIKLAAEMIDSGKAKAKLEEFIAATNEVA
ncbi:MAG: anthranilate phosphoribosyltransferase [Butyricicoccaceae bacterium]